MIPTIDRDTPLAACDDNALAASLTCQERQQLVEGYAELMAADLPDPTIAECLDMGRALWLARRGVLSEWPQAVATSPGMSDGQRAYWLDMAARGGELGEA